MTALVDLAAQRFGRLTVLDRSVGAGRVRWRCRCDCGRERTVDGANLRSGHTSSCGCLMRRHGHSAIELGNPSPTYKSWQCMWSRCTRSSDDHYPNYGGRGITVCSRWKNFSAFLADLGERPSRAHTLDRLDVNGVYESDNVRWATRAEQNRNRRDNVRITIGGRTMVAAEWARENGLKLNAVYERLRSGWSPVDAVTLPHRARRLER